MRVIVIHDHVSEDVRSGLIKGDLRFIMVARTEDGMSMISPIVTIDGRGCSCSGNPYLVYGDACAEFTGLDKLDLNIAVAGFHSGELEGWS